MTLPSVFEADSVLAIAGKLHAAQTARADSRQMVRPGCGAWRPLDRSSLYDYRYRAGTLCQHFACQRGFVEDLTDTPKGP